MKLIPLKPLLLVPLAKVSAHQSRGIFPESSIFLKIREIGAPLNLLMIARVICQRILQEVHYPDSIITPSKYDDPIYNVTAITELFYLTIYPKSTRR